MRGTETKQASMLCLMSPETEVSARPSDPANQGAGGRSARAARSGVRRNVRAHRPPSIPPERLLKSTLLIALYSVRSERQFCEQLNYNLLFRWFLDMDMIEPAFDHSVFSVNRNRLIAHDVAGQFFRAVVEQARRGKLMSADHFPVDGTLIESGASLKASRRRTTTRRRRTTLEIRAWARQESARGAHDRRRIQPAAHRETSAKEHAPCDRLNAMQRRLGRASLLNGDPPSAGFEEPPRVPQIGG